MYLKNSFTFSTVVLTRLLRSSLVIISIPLDLTQIFMQNTFFVVPLFGIQESEKESTKNAIYKRKLQSRHICELSEHTIVCLVLFFSESVFLRYKSHSFERILDKRLYRAGFNFGYVYIYIYPD